MTTPNRKTILLRAAYDLLRRAENAPYVEQATCVQVHYDEANCDGYCLMEDIAAELGIEPDTNPIPLAKEKAPF